jgi:hypothetical protein
MRIIIISQGLSFLLVALIMMSLQVGGHCSGVEREFSFLIFSRKIGGIKDTGGGGWGEG